MATVKAVAAGSFHGLPSGHGRAHAVLFRHGPHDTGDGGSFLPARTENELPGSTGRRWDERGRGRGWGVVGFGSRLDFVWFYLNKIGLNQIFKGSLLSTWPGEGHKHDNYRSRTCPWSKLKLSMINESWTTSINWKVKSVILILDLEPKTDMVWSTYHA